MIEIERELEKLRQADCLRALPAAAPGAMVNLSTNDYLGLADRADLMDEFLGQYAPRTSSMSASSSRLLTGNHAEYAELEAELSDLYGGRAALVFNCGYHANAGILPALADKDDTIIADKLIHASLIDGMRLCAANGTSTLRFNHNDMGHLRRLLERGKGAAGRTFVVVESIYSMDGDKAPLEELAEMRRQYGFWLYVDEAHGVGARGREGEGLMGELGLLDSADIIIGTCGKALASEGAWAITSPTVREWLVNRCRTLIFTTGLPPINVAWTRHIVRRTRGMAGERAHLQELGQWLTESLGGASEANGATHIVPHLCGENATAVALAAKLRAEGFYVLPIRHPTVPLGQARLRLSLKANMTKDELKPLVSIIKNTTL